MCPEAGCITASISFWAAAISGLCASLAFSAYCSCQLLDGCLACCAGLTVHELRLQRSARRQENSILKRNQAEQFTIQADKKSESLQKPPLVSELPESGGSKPCLPNGSWLLPEGSQNSLRQFIKSTDRISLPVELDNLPSNPLVRYNNLKSRQLHQPATFTLVPIGVPKEQPLPNVRLQKAKSKTSNH